MLLVAFPAHAQASTGVMDAHARSLRSSFHISALTSPTMQVNAGFETRYRDGNWVPVQVALRNDGPDFSGTLSINAAAYNGPYIGSGNLNTPSHYQMPITLANGAQKQVTIYIPIYFDVQSIIVRLLDSSGKVLITQDGVLNPLNVGDTLIGVLSDQSSGFGSLNAVSLPTQGSSVIVEFLKANTMPTMALALKNFTVLILDNFTTSSLSPAQLTALQSWVNQGGTLIEVGGPEWHRTLSALPPALLPVAVNGTTTIAAGSPLLPLGSPTSGHLGSNSPMYRGSVPDNVQSPVIASTATLQSDPNRSEVVLTAGTIPLITQTRQGQGIICYLAFDPTLEPIIGWPGATTLWRSVLFRSLGDQLLSNANFYPGPGYFNGSSRSLLASRMNGLLQALLPNTIPSPWTLAILLIGYILVLGPIRFFLLRRFKRRDWSWRIVLSSIIIFSALTYTLAIEEKGTSIVSNSVSIAQLNLDGSPAHVTTYLGVFAPNQGDLQVYVPGSGLVQPAPNAVYSYGPSDSGNQSPTTVTSIPNGTNVALQGVEFGTLHSILSEQDQPVQQGLVSHLTITNGSLVGTVTNALSYPLSDAYLLMPDNVLKVGQLAAGQTKQIRLPLNNTSSNTGLTLADLIVQNSGVAYPTSVYPIDPGSRPLSEAQRHLLILLALDGRGYYGFSGAGPVKPITPMLFPPSITTAPGASVSITTSSSVTISSSSVSLSGGPFVPTTDNNDPLLIPGAAATLVAWATRPLDSTNNVMVNGISPTGIHETLIQAPLAINLSGTLNLPPYFITGHLIDVEGNGVQSQFPGVYNMTIGSMTFEFSIPNLANLLVTGFTINEPTNAFQPGLGAVAGNGSSLPLLLYNWHKASWDSIALKQSSFSTNNVAAYIGPGGRVLLQLANQNPSLGTLIFGAPSLNLQGVAP